MREDSGVKSRYIQVSTKLYGWLCTCVLPLYFEGKNSPVLLKFCALGLEFA